MEQPEMTPLNAGGPGSTDVTDDDRLWALLCWIFTPILPFIVMLLEDKKARPYIKYHAVQSLIVGVVNIVASTLLSPLLGLGCFLGLGLFVYQIYLAVQAYNGEWVEIPVVTDFAKGQNWL